MKAKIEKEIDLIKDTNYFLVYAGEKMISAYSFRFHEPESSIFNEDRNYQKALALAKKIESDNFETIVTTVYETKEDLSEELNSLTKATT